MALLVIYCKLIFTNSRKENEKFNNKIFWGYQTCCFGTEIYVSENRTGEKLQKLI
jgi:hypothetical protein